MTTFVAEFTTNHMGNLNVLLKMVEQAANSGCHFIKMQKKDVKNFYSKEKLSSKYISPYGTTYEEYRNIFEFEKEDFDRFDKKCKQHNVDWFSTAQDINSLEFLLQFDLPMYKVASTNSRNKNFLVEFEKNVPTDREIVLSVAGSNLQEIENSLNLFPRHNIHLLHCVAEYPCKHENLRLGNIIKLTETFADNRISIGYSGHEVGVVPTYAAVDLGAKMVERHFCLSRHSFVHHIECSLEPDEFAEMTKTINSTVQLKDLYIDQLPQESYRSDFGMTNKEESFLLNQTYGADYINEKSNF